MRRLLYIRLWLIATLISLWVIGWGSLARTWGSTVTVTDACNDAGGGSQDILSLTATFDAATNMIHVALELCNKPDNQTKYQVLFDHTAPFFETDDNEDRVDGDAHRRYSMSTRSEQSAAVVQRLGVVHGSRTDRQRRQA
jgi:hypothetical protein